MPKYRVTVPYWYTLSTEVEASNEDEAFEKFGEVPDSLCTESYNGLLDSHDYEVIEIKKGEQ